MKKEPNLGGLGAESVPRGTILPRRTEKSKYFNAAIYHIERLCYPGVSGNNTKQRKEGKAFLQMLKDAGVID